MRHFGAIDERGRRSNISKVTIRYTKGTIYMMTARQVLIHLHGRNGGLSAVERVRWCHFESNFLDFLDFLDFHVSGGCEGLIRALKRP